MQWIQSFAAALVFAVLACLPAPAQSFSVIHSFSGGGDGYQPFSHITMDRAGNLYGTTSEYTGPGTVFEMKKSQSGWVLHTLLTFDNFNGGVPQGGVTFAPNGTLYGTTSEYGNGGIGCGDEGCGVVFNLRPGRTVCRSTLCPWVPTVLHNFTGGSDGGVPNYVDLAYDAAGNIYGTATQGGANGYYGVVFEMTHSGGSWVENVLYSFDGTDGWSPESGVVFDSTGALYGTTIYGGSSNYGNVYSLTPSGTGWTFANIYPFSNGIAGDNPVGPVMFDPAGNLYGTTLAGGTAGGGTVFQLVRSGGSWNLGMVYAFSGHNGPFGNLAMDTAGNLYGATFGEGAFGYGSIFTLTPGNGSWTYTDLHDFSGGADGGNPTGGVALDANGNLYGTASVGGTCGNCGVVWEITAP